MAKKQWELRCGRCCERLQENESCEFRGEVRPGVWEFVGDVDTSGMMCSCDDDSAWESREVRQKGGAA
jgi:hypothetical protein